MRFKFKTVWTTIPKELTNFDFPRYFHFAWIGNYGVVFTSNEICCHCTTRYGHNCCTQTTQNQFFHCYSFSSKLLCISLCPKYKTNMLNSFCFCEVFYWVYRFFPNNRYTNSELHQKDNPSLEVAPCRN